MTQADHSWPETAEGLLASFPGVSAARQVVGNLCVDFQPPDSVWPGYSVELYTIGDPSGEQHLGISALSGMGGAYTYLRLSESCTPENWTGDVAAEGGVEPQEALRIALNGVCLFAAYLRLPAGQKRLLAQLPGGTEKVGDYMITREEFANHLAESGQPVTSCSDALPQEATFAVAARIFGINIEE